jgi:hypothetical protein
MGTNKQKAFSTILEDPSQDRKVIIVLLSGISLPRALACLFLVLRFNMYSHLQILSVLNETLLAKVTAAAFLLLLAPLSLFLLDSYSFYYQKPSNLPVLNLEGWQFEKAKSRYISNVFYYLKLGREQVRSIPHCRRTAVKARGLLWILNFASCAEAYTVNLPSFATNHSSSGALKGTSLFFPNNSLRS